MPRRPLLLASALLASALGALGASCTPTPIEQPPLDVAVFPKVAYSGYAPSGTFRVMISTGADAPRWAVEDPSVASIEPAPAPSIPNTDVTGLSFALITTKRAGETGIRMTSGDKVVTTRLVVAAYTDADLAAGKARYTTASTDGARAPCIQCHARDGGVGVDHSPLKMGGFDAPAILGVIERATYPESPTGQSITSSFSPRGPLSFAQHRWNLTDAERAGVVAYLRSLPLGGL